MTDRERLVELIQKKTCRNGTCMPNCGECKYVPLTDEDVDRLADHILADGWTRLPCKVGEWIWYVYRNEINKAKVEEINYSASKHGHYSYNFSIYAYDFKNKRQVTYHPINETQKNKSNINEVEGIDFAEDVYVFLTREEAENVLRGGAE